jgi:predicted ferric reductase
LPGTNFAITMGIIALLGMIILLSITLYLKIKYNIWKFSHKFMVVVFIFAILHILFISSDISRDLFLKSYILFFSLLGLMSGSYRSFLRFLFNKDFDFVVKNVSILNGNVVEVELEPIKEILKFIPGQFIFIKFFDKGISSESHPFSISGAVSENNLKITVKALGDFTNTLKNVKVGAKAKIEGPFGEFFENRKNTKEVWLAGGVGITPFLSLARSLKNIDNDIYLFYCLNDEAEAIFLEELKNISFKNSKFHLIVWYSKERGRINVDAIEKLVNGILHTDIYLCGPPIFMTSLESQFINKGVDKNNIYFEEFNFL